VDKQIFDLLSEMSKEMKSMKSDILDLKSEMHNRFDTIERKLEGVGGQFELPMNQELLT
jgi:regulator of replication initiation timing